MVGGGGGSKANLVFIFGPKLKFGTLDLDLDQAEQFRTQHHTNLQEIKF